MKVAFVSLDFGEFCIRLADALGRRSDLLLLLPRREAEPYLDHLDASIKRELFHKPRYRQPLRQLVMLRQLVRSIRRFQPDVIHLQQGHLWFNFVLPLLGRSPLVVTVHDPVAHLGDRGAQKTPQSVMDLAFKRADQIIVHGEEMKRVVEHRLGIAPERIHVIPLVAIGEAPSEGAPVEDDTVLFFGRIWEYKGLQYLIQAEPLIAEQVPGVKFVIAGEGEDFTPYRQMMAHPERFEVHNRHIDDAEIPGLFGRAAVVVLPYVDASQSGVIPLAYTFGKPVVATPVGSLTEMVEDGRTGYLVPPRDVEALAAAVVRLLRDRALRREMGQNGRRKLEQQCAAPVVAAQTLAVYERALASADRRQRGGEGHEP